MKMGNNYALALSSSMKHLTNTQVLELPGNRLGKKGGVAIIGSLSDRIRNINLDNNKIGTDGIASLVGWIDHLNVRC
jgi:Leucine-rich repeat (LRR) protein